MNRYIRGVIYLIVGIIRVTILKIKYGKLIRFGFPIFMSPLSELDIENNCHVDIGRNFKLRDGAKLRVRCGADIKFGDNVSINSFNVVTCRKSIKIGNNVQIAPGVQIYDHDHDYRKALNNRDFICEKIVIGDNVWIGAQTVILKGTEIGDNSVVAAGSVVRGKFSKNNLIYNKTLIMAKENAEYTLYRQL